MAVGGTWAILLGAMLVRPQEDIGDEIEQSSGGRWVSPSTLSCPSGSRLGSAHNLAIGFNPAREY